MTEQWNAYTADGKQTNQILTRNQAIPAGLYHLVAECIIQHRDGSLLFMKRAATKASYPNFYEATAGGSALFGETAEQAVLREVYEETGIRLNLAQLHHHTHLVSHEHQCLIDCYWARVDWDKATIQIQEEETSDFIWVAPEQLAHFLETQPVIPRQKEYVKRLFLASK